MHKRNRYTYIIPADINLYAFILLYGSELIEPFFIAKATIKALTIA